ncbi:MAG: hypothetical protein ABFS37_15190 [Acidobacteriota bacterium]
MLKGFLSRLNAVSQQASIKVEALGDGITAYRLHSRWTRMLGFEVSIYRIGDLLADSLRRVAALEPRRMLTGHGIDAGNPADRLLAKAKSIERAAAKSKRLIDEGVFPRTVVRRVFSKGRPKDRKVKRKENEQLPMARLE